jgi:REP element-mobilizing transposase RayT
MVRPLRFDVRGGFYHVIHQGQRSEKLFPKARGYQQFIDFLAQTVRMHNVRIHAYALLPSSYQLIVATPEANLSSVMQWLNGVYGSWLNREYADQGAVFHDRFRAVLFDPDSALLRVSRHVHLAPIRSFLVDPTELDATSPQLFDRTIVQQRIKSLREYPWSSYLAYAGYGKAPPWLRREEIYHSLLEQEPDGGRPDALYRAYVEQPARLGVQETILQQVRDKVFLGKDDFIAKMRKSADRENRRGGRPRLGWEKIVKAVEKVRGRPWKEFMNQYGDRGRDLALYIGRYYGGYTLKELGERVGGLGFTAVGQAVTRIQGRLATDNKLKKEFDNVRRALAVTGPAER